MKGPAAAAYRWLDERLGLSGILGLLGHKDVPVHRFTSFYCFGGLALCFFIMQVATGVLLMLYYRPSPNEAYESVAFITRSVPFGWLIRSIHAWSASLMVFFMFLHLATVYFMKAYRKPRELNWVSGCILMFLVLGFCFSGSLLPWNELAFFAVTIGAASTRSLPVVGEWVFGILWSGGRVSGNTLSQFYTLHVAVLPILTAAVLGLHFYLVQKHGMSVPPSAETEARRHAPVRFLPDFLMRDLLNSTLAFMVLVGLATLFPTELGEKADPFVPASLGIRPEWYFVVVFQTLKILPGGQLFGVEYETLAMLAFGAGAALLVLVPFLDRAIHSRGRSPGFTLIGAAALAYAVVMTSWGLRSPAPAYLSLGTAALLIVALLFSRMRLRRSAG